MQFKTFAFVFTGATVALAATEPTVQSHPIFKPFANISVHELPLARRACPVGYGLCPGGCCKLDGYCCGSGCCNKGYGCCENKGCFPIGAQCCSNGGYCNSGYYCVKTIFGNIGCCPNGRVGFGPVRHIDCN
ncbi:hypothetical protein BKA62DRAFT_714038 [Auriculariales sp. MPI-PUGE-AT-0066]|nr:hypothetical protein BKA62DRAFT_714038 [Auriculariales sp. MPI-PUGE-AT-0066]